MEHDHPAARGADELLHFGSPHLGTFISSPTLQMRTALFLIAGLLLLAASFVLGRLFFESFPPEVAWLTVAFVLLWCLATFFNIWVGATRDGYPWGKELSLFLMVFGIPAIVAIGFKWQLL